MVCHINNQMLNYTLLRAEPHRIFRLFFLDQHLPKKFVDRLNLFVHLLNLQPHCLVARQYRAELRKGSYDLDVDLHRPLALENAREHGYTLFGESKWWIT